jgi:hypothetical protein
MTWRAHLTYRGEKTPDPLSFQLATPSEIGLFADVVQNIDWILLRNERWEKNHVTPARLTTRKKALIERINTMSPNLLRAYLVEMLTDAAPQDVEKFIVALRAQNFVGAKV